MAKPEDYKGDDAVRVKCVRDYTVKGGSGGADAVDVEFKAGQTYAMNPRSAAHMLRKVYATYGDPRPGQKRGEYLGDASFFVDAGADDAKADDTKKPAAKKAAPKAASRAKAATDGDGGK